MRAARAFTLIEVVVVIGIIVLLAGLVLSVTVVVAQGSEVRRTEQAIRLLDQAVLDWEAETSRKLTWGENGEPFNGSVYDMQWDTPHIFRITELLNTVARAAGAKAIVSQIDPDLLRVYRVEDDQSWPWVPSKLQDDVRDFWAIDNNANLPSLGLTVLDAWGEPIMVVHPGRVHNPAVFPDDQGFDPDADGTIRVDAEDQYGIARNRRVLFVSAGPDGLFGSVDDNIYSYEPEVDQRP